MPRAYVLTVSDRCSAGEREDASGPAVAAELAGFDVETGLCPDGEANVAQALLSALAAGFDLIVTTGGTGVGPRDETPEGTRQVIAKELPGIPQLLVAASPRAALGRGIAGVVGRTLIVNLPGKPSAAREGIQVVLPFTAHILEQLRGGDHT
ncbi:MAG: MogA/MoaB family molybdenum cofactor biosynthesis protein [Propionibacteriaceae bacterium]|jgi:molybdenum cofactor synthesis domain-containing protein|nr:MogA/MoaB family molybdenum cofactor biosynthesis protein [Propionibacteriaceae bacterium]